MWHCQKARARRKTRGAGAFPQQSIWVRKAVPKHQTNKGGFRLQGHSAADSLMRFPPTPPPHPPSLPMRTRCLFSCTNPTINMIDTEGRKNHAWGDVTKRTQASPSEQWDLLQQLCRLSQHRDLLSFKLKYLWSHTDVLCGKELCLLHMPLVEATPVLRQSESGLETCSLSGPFQKQQDAFLHRWKWHEPKVDRMTAAPRWYCSSYTPTEGEKDHILPR